MKGQWVGKWKEKRERMKVGKVIQDHPQKFDQFFHGRASSSEITSETNASSKARSLKAHGPRSPQFLFRRAPKPE